MNDKRITYEIFREECVGDSLAKHNFNFMALDAAVCNLSSLFFKTENDNTPLSTSFNHLQKNLRQYNLNLTQMNETFRFDRTQTAIGVLSSYWNKQEFTVQFEYNKSTVGGKVSNIIIESGDITFLPNLTANAFRYLRNNYPASEFLPNTICNVVIPIFSNDGTITKSYSYKNTDNQDVTTENPPVFNKIKSTKDNEEYRVVNVEFGKNDSNFISTPVFRFQKLSNRWTYVEMLSTACPPITIPTPEVTTQTNNQVHTDSLKNRTKTEAGPCQTISFNKWYTDDVYLSGKATAKGRFNRKTGPIGITFKLPNNKTFDCNYTAKNAGTGLTLTWNQNKVVMVEDPNTGSLMRANERAAKKLPVLRKEWAIPAAYKNNKKTQFKLTKSNDTNNVTSFTACASKKITKKV